MNKRSYIYNKVKILPEIFDPKATNIALKLILTFEISGLLTTSTVFAITGKFFASNAFALIYSVTSEIFPTNAR